MKREPNRPEEASTSGTASAVQQPTAGLSDVDGYEPPRMVMLGSLHDLLGKSTPDLDETDPFGPFLNKIGM